MTRRRLYTVAAALVFAGTIGATAAPAFAQQVCVVIARDPQGHQVEEYCVNI